MMRLAITALGLAAALLSALPGAASADEIFLKDGGVVRGIIEEEIPARKCDLCNGEGRVVCPACRGAKVAPSGAQCPDCAGVGVVRCGACGGTGALPKGVKIRSRGALVAISGAEIARIEKKPADDRDVYSPAKYYEIALSKMDPGDAGKRFELACFLFGAECYDLAKPEFVEAARLDAGKYGKKAELFVGAIQEKRNLVALDILNDGLKAYRRNDNRAALQKFLKVKIEFPDVRLSKDIDYQKEMIGRGAPGADAPRLLEEFISKLKDGINSQDVCNLCNGSGFRDCTACGGSKKAACPTCQGKKMVSCPHCRGTGLVVCYGCMGQKIIHPLDVLGRKCTVCRGKGSLQCNHCTGTGKLACEDCKGTGFAEKSVCAACKGMGKVLCDCQKDLSKVTLKLRWGPVGQRKAGGETANAVWQASSDGAVITAVRAEDLYPKNSVMFLQFFCADKAALFAVAVDNRNGKKALQFSPSAKGLRAVTDGHRQFEVKEDRKLLEKLKAEGALQRFASLFEGAVVVPGAYANFIAVFDEGLGDEKIADIFWGANVNEMIKLEKKCLADEELDAVKATLSADNLFQGK